MLEITHRVILDGHQAAIAAENLLRTQPEAVVPMPSCAAPPPVFVG